MPLLARDQPADAKDMSEFCSSCSCPGCSAVKAERREKEQKKQRLRNERDARRARRVAAESEAAENAYREALMVWFLVNTAQDQNHANQIIEQIARALELRVGQVNQRRTRTAVKLSIRAQRLQGLSDAGRWAALPGSTGAELPDYCPKCGGMKTEGRKCRRRSCS